MVLATVDGQRPAIRARRALQGNRPAIRLVIVFYTNYQSHKGRDLKARIRVRRWYFTGTTGTARCARKGRSSALAAAENDAYFKSRPWQSRLGAWASQQSEPVESRELRSSAAVAAAARRFGIPYGGPGTPEPKHVRRRYPRPPHWGGFRLQRRCGGTVGGG